MAGEIRAGLVYFVGAGPGDPELITVRGVRIIGEADLVVYAGSLVPDEIMALAKEGAQLHDSAPLTLEETHSLLAEGVEEGGVVARVHSGDPSLYGAIREQIRLLEADGIAYEVVPGVSAAFAAMARLGREFTVPEKTQTLIITRIGGRTPVPDSEGLSLLAAHRSSMAIYLSASRIEEVVKELKAGYPEDTPVVVAHRVGWPDETFIFGSLSDIAQKVKEKGVTRQAVILVGDGLDLADGTRSLLYHPKFAHSFRGKKDD